MNSHNFFDATILKESLSRALVPFYPMAGRLKEANHNGRLEIECNGEGALFVEAETTHSLVDFGDFKPTPELMRLVVPSCDYSRGHALIPLLMVQLTRFSCGGVTLGFAQHHRVADGFGHLHFINSWARLARGLDLQVAPIHERTPHLVPRNPPQVMFRHLEHHPTKISPGGFVPSVNPDSQTTITSFFKITNDQISALKQQATSSEMNSDEYYKLSTYEVLAAHILRAACKARGLADDQEVKLYIPVDGRYRLKNPALPQGFCGNAIFIATYIAKSGDITRNPLGYVAGKIHETLKTMTDEEYLRSAIDYLETQPNLTSLVRGAHTYKCPNLLVNSWLKFPFYEADFGWGKPLLAGRGGGACDGLSYLVPSPNRVDGIHLMISLLNQHTVLFEKYLYDF